MKCYTFELTHDNGKFNLSLYSTDEETARKIIMESEGCPDHAIQLEAVL